MLGMPLADLGRRQSARFLEQSLKLILLFSCLHARLGLPLAPPAAGKQPVRNVLKAVRQGQALLAHEQPLEAIAIFEAVLESDPENEAAELGLSSAYRKVFNHGEARRVLLHAVRVHPESAAPLIALAEMEIESQSYDDALAHLDRAAKLAPFNPKIHIDRATAYQSKGRSNNALRELDTALKLAPRAAVAYYLKGMIYAELNQNARAIEAAEKAFTLQPQNARARTLLARLDVRVNRCAQAVTLLQPLAVSSESETLYLLARAYECAGQEELAHRTMARFSERSRLEHSQRQDRMQADYLATTAGDLARKNQLAPALELLHQALGKDPTNGKANLQLAKVYYSLGQLSQALSAIEQALKADPFQPDCLYVLGLVLEGQGDLAGALSALERAVRVNPRESDAYYETGIIHLKRKNRARALAAFRKAVETSPDDPDYRRALQQAEAGGQ